MYNYTEEDGQAVNTSRMFFEHEILDLWDKGYDEHIISQTLDIPEKMVKQIIINNKHKV